MTGGPIGSAVGALTAGAGDARYAKRSNNLSDLSSASSARTSLGLGASAVMSTAQIAADSALTGTYVRPRGKTTSGAVAPSTGYNVVDYGAVGGAISLSSSAIATGTAILTDSTATFTSADVGKTVLVAGAGAAGVTLQTTIAGFTDSHTVTLTANANTTVSGARAVYGYDDSAAFQAAINAAVVAATGAGDVVLVPCDSYLVLTGLTMTTGTTLASLGNPGMGAGMAWGATRLLIGSGIIGLDYGASGNSSLQGIHLVGIHFHDHGGWATGGTRVRRRSNNAFTDCAWSGFTTGYGVHLDGTGDTVQYSTLVNPRINDCLVGLKQTSANGTRVLGGIFHGNHNAGSVRAGSTGVQNISGDTLRLIGTVFQEWNIAVDIQVGENCEMTSCRVEVCNTGLKNAGPNTGVFGGSFNNNLLSSAGTACDNQAGATGLVFFPADVTAIATYLADAGTGTKSFINGASADTDNFGFISTADPMLANNAQTINANRAVYFRVKNGGWISKIRIFSNTQSGNVCVGVYRNSGNGLSATPGSRAATSGSVAMSAATQDVSLGGSVYVNPGDWLSFVIDNATAQMWATSGAVLASSAFAGRSGYQDTAFPLPSSATMTAGLIRGLVLIGVP